MPRLSHTFDITAVDAETVERIVDALHELVRACRFDGRGWLLVPDEPTLERLERRAEGLGLVDRRRAEELRRKRREAAERLRDGTSRPAEEVDELVVEASRTALQLQRGRHLAPRSHYHVAELSPEGVPVEPGDDADKGWSGTGLTLTSWDEEGTCSVDFAMPDAVGTDEPAVTWGTVRHDVPAGRLTWSGQVRLPGRGAWLRSASGTLEADTRVWYAAVAGGADALPVRLRATHALVDLDAWLVPRAAPEGRWSVEAVLDVRGRGVFRPLVAVAFHALAASFRREDRGNARRGTGEPTTRERLDRTARAWDRIARNAHRIPDLLHETARAMREASPGG